MNEKDGEFAVKVARETIESWVKKREEFQPKKYPEIFNEKRGVFVTIHMYPENELRGCIGFPEPIFPLIKAIVKAGIESTQDPRFAPLEERELEKIIVEVSILTRPKLIPVKNPEAYLEEIEIGRDGLIIERGFSSGLLLPQVPLEWKWNVKTFIIQLCQKASLPSDAWLDPKTRIYKFQAEIFSEKKPKS